MEKTDKVSNNQRENDIEKIKSLSVYKLVSDNFDLISDFVDVECEINDRVTQIETKHQIMGPIDKKKIKRDIDDLNKEEAELLDQLITKLDVVDGVKMIPDNKDLIKALDIVYDEKNTEDDDDDDEAENDFENERTDFSSEEEYIPNISEKIKRRLIERGILQPENNDKELQEQETDAKIISIDEQARLEKVRELLKNVTEDKKSTDDFDPQKKQVEILASSGIKTKKELLGKYYDDAGRQMLGVAEIYAYFEREICENKEPDLDQIWLTFKKMAKVFKLTSWQINRFEMSFNKLKEVAKNIEDFWVKNKNKESSDIALEVFGFKPDGEININKEKFSLVCYCFNHDDFSKIYKSDEDSEEDATECDGFFTPCFKYNTVVIDNSRTVSDNELNETLIHEKKHLVDCLIDEAFSEANFIEDGSTNYDVVREKYFNRLLKEAKIETFAFFKEGWDAYAIYRNLIENYTPALTTRHEWTKLGKEYRDMETNVLEEMSWKEFKNSVVSYRRRFRDELKKSLMLLETLELAGFPRERIISLFQTVPLEQWNKHLSRLERSKYFLEETENNIKQRFDNLMIRKEELEKEIDSYKKSTSLSVRMFKYIRRDEGWQNKKELNSIKKETKYLNELLEDIKDVKMNK